MRHEADRNEIVVEMIEERTAAGAAVERPAEGMLRQARPVFFGGDLPQLLQAKSEFLRFAALVEAEALQQRLAEVAAGAFGEQRVFRAQLHAAGEAVLVMAVLGHTHVAGGNAHHRAVVIEQNLAGGKAGIDFNAQRFRFGREPAADIAEGDDIVAVIVHQRRHHQTGQTHRGGGRKPIETVVADLGLDRTVFVSPVRNEPVEADGIDDGAREDVRADLGSLLDHDHAGLGRKLFEPDRGREPGGPRADDHHVEFHCVTGRQFVSAHRSSGRRSCSGPTPGIAPRSRVLPETNGGPIPADRAIGRSPRGRGSIGPWCYSNSKDTAILSKRYANRWWSPTDRRYGRRAGLRRHAGATETPDPVFALSTRPRRRAWLPALPHGLTAPGMNRNRDQAAREL